MTTTDTEKTCTKCQRLLPRTDFSPGRSRDGLAYWCKSCHNSKNRERLRTKRLQAVGQDMPACPCEEWQCADGHRFWRPTGEDSGQCPSCLEPCCIRTGRFTHPGQLPEDVEYIGTDEYLPGDHFTTAHTLHLPRGPLLW